MKENNNVNINVAGRSAITMKMNKKVLNSSLVILLALGLGGCAVGSSTTTSHKTHEASSSQVVKQSHKKSEKSASTSAKTAAATNHSASTNVASSSSTTSSAKNVTTSSAANTTNNGANQQVTAPAKVASSSSSVKEQKSVQLGLGDVATWTDSEGVTHNVDSDGMDRYTTKGSSQVQYKNWSGALPNGVTVSHNE
nr:hypothetical protein [Limosilactobacillus vaginalis]